MPQFWLGGRTSLRRRASRHAATADVRNVQVSDAEKYSLKKELMAASGLSDKFEHKFDSESFFKVHPPLLSATRLGPR